MSWQQVNLLPRSKSKSGAIDFNQVTGQTVLIAWLAFAVLLLLLSGWFFYQTDQLKKSYREYSNKRLNASLEVEEYRIKYPSKALDPSVQQTLTKYQRQYQGKKHLIHMLNRNRIVSRTGFSGHLVGLSEQHETDLQVTDILIDDEGEYIELQGLVFEAEVVPQYLQRLSKEAVFKNQNFEVFSAIKSEKHKGILEFDLRSHYVEGVQAKE